MKTSFKRFAASALLLSAFAYAWGITIPQGTDVPLVFDQSLSSKTAKVGDRVKLHVAEDVQAGDQTVIKAGTPVTGVISGVKKRGHFGVNAKIQITLNPVRSVSGKRIPLAPKSKGKQLKGSKTDKAAIASGAGAVVLGPVGLVGGYFINGKQVNVKPGDKLVSEVAHDVSIASK